MMTRITLIVSVLTALVALLGGVQWIVGEWRAWSWRRKQTGKWLVLVGLCLTPAIVDAACSGSGTTRTCTSGTSSADIQSAVDAVTDPGVITLNNGTYTISSNINFPMTKSITLVCESEGGCTLNQSSFATIGMNSTCDGSSTKLYRISGMVFPVTSGSRIDFNAYGAVSGSCTITQVRIDNNSFTGGATAGVRVLAFGSGDYETNVYGVIDHNTFSMAASVTVMEFYGPSLLDGASGAHGTANNMYLEDNEITVTTMDDPGNSCMDSTGNPALVVRFNKSTNCRWATHGSTSSGTRNLEFYGNEVVMTSGADPSYRDCFRAIYSQGSGVIKAWKNKFTCVDSPTNAIALGTNHYRSAGHVTAGYSNPPGQCEGANALDGNRSPDATYQGYPCWHQPGRDVDGTLHPIYAWGNVDGGGNKVDFYLYTSSDMLSGWSAPVYGDEHLQYDRDAYNAVSVNAQSSSSSPFNGTTGMGFGTLANRPTTCTAESESADSGYGGVGYWATDQGSWNTSSSNSLGVNFAGDDGVLYHCSSTNTWATEYTPYTYPHPLVGGGESSGAYALFLRSWPLALETASVLGALYHWRGAVAGVLIFLLGCGVTGASLISHTARSVYHTSKRVGSHTVERLAVAYLTLTKKDTDV